MLLRRPQLRRVLQQQHWQLPQPHRVLLLRMTTGTSSPPAHISFFFHRSFMALCNLHLQLTPAIFSSQLHRVLQSSSPAHISYFSSPLHSVLRLLRLYCDCRRFIIASRRHRLLVHRNVVIQQQHHTDRLPTANTHSIDIFSCLCCYPAENQLSLPPYTSFHRARDALLRMYADSRSLFVR